MHWRLIEAPLFGAVLFMLEYARRTVMAVGSEVTAALAELDVKINAEADQRAAEVIEAVSADAQTAELIPRKFAAVADIVPDAGVENPGEGEGEVEVGTAVV